MAGPGDGWLSRGQLVTIAAVTLAALLVGTSVALNSVIFTENAASREDAPDGGAVLRVDREAARAANGAVTSVNRHDAASHRTLRENLTAAVAARDSLTSGGRAADGTVVTTAVLSVTNRTDVTHDDDLRNFTNASGAANWTLAEGTATTDAFRMHVYADELALASGPAEPFRVLVAGDGATWTMNVTNDSVADEIVVSVTDGAGNTDSCAAGGPGTWINVSASTVGGADCPALEFASDVDPPYAIRYENAGRVRGTYDLTAITSEPVDPAHFHAGGGSPRATFAIHSTILRVAYESERTSYTGRIEVQAGA